MQHVIAFMATRRRLISKPSFSSYCCMKESSAEFRLNTFNTNASNVCEIPTTMQNLNTQLTVEVGHVCGFPQIYHLTELWFIVNAPTIHKNADLYSLWRPWPPWLRLDRSCSDIPLKEKKVGGGVLICNILLEFSLAGCHSVPGCVTATVKQAMSFSRLPSDASLLT